MLRNLTNVATICGNQGIKFQQQSWGGRVSLSPARSSREMPDKEFRTGQTVPQSGIYRVKHKQHRLPHEVTLLGGQLFPRCSKCKDSVEFYVVRQAIPIQSDSSFKVAVYELPVVDDEPPKKIAS